jgi:type IV secretory pathway VirB10-like protein
MNNKTIAIVLVVLNIFIGLLGNLLPDALKKKIEGIFGNYSIIVWIVAIVVSVALYIWLARKSEKLEDNTQPPASNPPVSEPQPTQPQTLPPTPIVVVVPAPVVTQTPAPKSQTNGQTSTKEQIVALIDAGEMDTALDILNGRFLHKNATYMDLYKELFEQPNNFSSAAHRSKLKRFVIVYWK